MENVVSFQSNRSKPRRAAAIDQTGAKILFFTGVRYARADLADPCLPVPAVNAARDGAVSEQASRPSLDLAAH